MLNLTPEEKKERRRIYNLEYSKKYYHLIKETEPDNHEQRLSKIREQAKERYHRIKETTPETKTTKKRNIKIDINNLKINN
jgi:hypothetical protein